MRSLLLVSFIALSALMAGCTTHSSGGNQGTQAGAPQQGGQGGQQDGRGGGQTRTTAWQCAVQFENGIVACGTYTSAASDAELQQHCAEIPGQPVQQCPANNFQVTCLIRVEGADIRFRMAGAANQRDAMVQICQQSNGQVQR
ncbi:MAG: hypothetical protein KF789_12940 [Bdellovibrionaceae bacterium]|nr:hypothetical protein [Pseudobdellovibrionaceae bacterium]